jgi:hypothetical protein
MRQVVPVLIGACIGLLFLAAQYWTQRWLRGRQERAAVEAKQRAEVESQCRTAVHEAGHALCAWACLLIDRIIVAQIDDHKHVRYRWWHPSFKDDVEWCDMVIGLAGLAAERLVYGREREGVSKDLEDVRASVAWVIDHKATAPWEVGDLQPLPFAHLFEPPLTPEEERCVQIGYAKACQLLRDGKDRHDRLVSALLCHRTMTYKQITSILGDRYWMGAKVMSAALKRSDAMKAGFVEIPFVKSVDAGALTLQVSGKSGC